MNNKVDVQINGGGGIVPCTYKTVVLKPNFVGQKNLLTQTMMNERDTKYVIKHNYTIGGGITGVADVHYVSPFENSGWEDAHEAWIAADNAYTNDPNETTLAAKNAAYAALQNTPRYYYYDKKQVVVRAGQYISVPNRCILFSAAGAQVEFPNGVAEADTVVYICSLTQGDYEYSLTNAIVMPKECLIEFDGGSISNGSFVGTDTAIIAPKTAIFTNVVIRGTWNVPDITSAWFSDADENNGLKNVFALQDENVLNKIVIEEGDYTVSVSTGRESALECLSNLDLYILGNIRLQANNLESYYIIRCNNTSNITISGSGCIIGDKDTHIGTEGEHGMGIGIYKSKFITIKDITIKDCWGDCIYIGGGNNDTKPENIIIDNVNLDNGRRQGISVVNGENISITNSRITNVKGTNPQAAIDIEPNAGQSVSNIYIANIYVKDCEKGIVVYKTSSYTKESIIIDNCNINCTAIGISLNGISTSITVSNNCIKTKYIAILCNTTDGAQDNIMSFVNNIIYQTDIPEEGSNYAAYPFVVRALKGNYEFNHNFINSVLPVFAFASGTKRIIENDITCPKLFYDNESNNVSVIGNSIIGNINIPGKTSFIERNRITGTILSTTRVESDTTGNRSYITNNIISDPTDGGSLFESQGELYITNNRFVNIRFHITGDVGHFNNNIVDYTTNYKHNGGIILNFGDFDFIGNTVTYKGTSLIDPETDNPYSVYLVRARNNVNNTISIYRDMRCIFYTANNENSNVTGNILLFNIDTSLPEEQQHVATVDFIVNSTNVGYVQPVYKNAGSTAERPTFPISENYYMGCSYFDKTLVKTIWWNGYCWVDADDVPVDYYYHNTVTDYNIGKRINTRVDIGETIDYQHPRDEEIIDCKVLDVHAGDLIKIVGVGDYNPTSYALVDNNGVLLRRSNPVSVGDTYDYPPKLYVNIEADCKLILNFRNALTNPPYSNRMGIPYNAVIYSNYIEQQDSESN